MRNLLRFLSFPRHIHIYSSTWIDEIWVRSLAQTLGQSARYSARIVIAGNRSAWPADLIERYRASGIEVLHCVSERDVRRLNMKFVVTASSGLQRDLFGTRLTHLCHMPHSLASLHAIYPEGAFDGYDVLFAAGPHHAAEYKAIRSARGLPAGRVFAVGYGKMDLMKFTHGHIGAPLSIPTILIAPSWGEHNIFNTVGMELVTSLLAEGYRVILRPHPSFLVHREPAFEAIRQALENHPSFQIESSEDVGKAFFAADVMVSDYSGIAFEYAAVCRRPVIFVDLPRKVLNHAWATIGMDPVEVALRVELGLVVSPSADEVLAAVRRCFVPAADGFSPADDVIDKFLYRADSVAARAELAITNLLEANP